MIRRPPSSTLDPSSAASDVYRRRALAQAGIQLYPGVSGDADQAVAALLAGQLSYDPDTVCSHHEHDHGHDCATHDCAQDHQGCPGNH